ncbi:protein LSM12 [Entomortierella parvispora]|uniref:Protein LSM12 n=1 Tax=Entomortierella parvispora TaxID=205924 RepID=A0A9P3HIB4_9FUNG|nr:protein LSM12 [Entomortierella parvispora]
MESLNKKTPSGTTPLSFASAAAASKTTATSATGTATPGTGASTPSAKNGSHPSTTQASPVLGSQSSATLSSRPQSGKSSAAPTTASSPTTPAAPTNGLEWILEMPVRVVTTADEIFEGKVYAYDVTMNCLCPSKSVSATGTPTTYYSPSLGNNNSNNGNAGARPKYDFRILKLNYIKDVTPLESLNTSQNKSGAESSAATASIKSNNGSAASSPKPESGEEERVNNNTFGSTYASVLPAVGYVQLDKIQQKEQQAVREAHAAAARIGVGVSTIAQDIFDALSKTLPCRWAKDSIVVMDEVIIAPPYEPENCKANASSSYTLARVRKVLEGERSRLANGRK